MDRLRKFFGLPTPERFLLLRAFALLAVVRVALWLLPFKVLRWILSKLAHAYAPRPDEGHFPSESGAWALQAASRYVPRATCLTQAMAGQLLLGLNGTPSSVRIGVAKHGEGNFEAHAWLESGGRILIGGVDADQRYACLMAFNPWER
jgi:Transglutaminase-like superfamily